MRISQCAIMPIIQTREKVTFLALSVYAEFIAVTELCILLSRNVSGTLMQLNRLAGIIIVCTLQVSLSICSSTPSSPCQHPAVGEELRM